MCGETYSMTSADISAMISDLKRFDPTLDFLCGQPTIEVSECASGEYVLFSDVTELVSKIQVGLVALSYLGLLPSKEECADESNTAKLALDTLKEGDFEEKLIVLLTFLKKLINELRKDHAT